MAEKLRLTGSFDEYGYRPGLAGSLAAGLMRASKPTRYPTSVTDRLIGGVFDGLATHRKMRIDDEVAIADRERREIEMETLRRNATIQRQLDQLRGMYKDPDLSVTGQTMTLPQYIERAAMISGDPKTLIDLATLQQGRYDLDASTVNKLLDKGATLDQINNYQRTGVASPELQEQMTLHSKEEEESRSLAREEAQDTQYYNAIDKFVGADEVFQKHDTNIKDTTNRRAQIIADLRRFTDEKGEYRGLIEQAAGGDYSTKITNLADTQGKENLLALVSDIESRIAFQNLKTLKQTGTTLGALSEEEFKNLAKDLGSFNINMSVDVLLKQLTRIQDRVTNMYDLAIDNATKNRRKSARTARVFGERANKALRGRNQEQYNLDRYNLGQKNVATGNELGGLVIKN